jgi:hypothetical protein
MSEYQNFLKLLTDNMPFEDKGIAKAVEHFTRLNPSKPFKVLRRPDSTNYNVLKYDAEIGDGKKIIRVEIKTDHRSSETGNFFIEYSGYGKPTGIAITDAHYYVINDTVNYYMISVRRLLALIKRCAETGKLRRVQMCSPNGHVTKGYIFKKAVLLKFAMVI